MEYPNYLYPVENSNFRHHEFVSESNKAVIVLPEIFGINQNIKDIVSRFNTEFNLPSFALDFYYPIDKQVHDLDYSLDLDHARELKAETKAEDFVEIFKQTLDLIQLNHPNISKFIVVGFCFGGKLAFLSGIDKRVKTIFSLYGAGSNEIFYENKSVVQILANTRKGDKDLFVKGFFGSEDSSIPEVDRKLIKETLTDADINYESFEYPAGHAFFRIGGQNYHQDSSNKSWEIIRRLLINA